MIAKCIGGPKNGELIEYTGNIYICTETIKGRGRAADSTVECHYLYRQYALNGGLVRAYIYEGLSEHEAVKLALQEELELYLITLPQGDTMDDIDRRRELRETAYQQPIAQGVGVLITAGLKALFGLIAKRVKKS